MVESERAGSIWVETGLGGKDKKERRGDFFADRIAGYLPPNGKILDIGSGNAYIARRLQELQFKIYPTDIKNLREADVGNYVISNGLALPYLEQEFDASLLLMTLHHTPDPRQVLTEATRVAPRIVVVEDLLDKKNPLHLALMAVDWMQNPGWRPQISTYHNHREWLELFQQTGLSVAHMDIYRDVPQAHGLYVLESRKS
jgi:ubiquinone/menaquinone biosynthesis C-methylase UbiE